MTDFFLRFASNLQTAGFFKLDKRLSFFYTELVILLFPNGKDGFDVGIVCKGGLQLNFRKESMPAACAALLCCIFPEVRPMARFG